MPQNPNPTGQPQPGNQGFFASIMDHFRNPQPGGAPQGQSSGAPISADPNNPTVPGNGQQQQQNQQQQQQEKSPLADFADLWQTPTPKAGEQPQTDWNDPLSIVPGQSIDPAKIQEASKKINFAAVLNPDTVKKALAGDTVAFGEAINAVAQAAFANSAMLSSRITDRTLRDMAPRLLNDALPHHLKRHGVNEGLGSKNPIFNNPAVAPMLEGLKVQLQQKFPQASAAEITQKAEAYISEFAQAVTGGKGGNPGNPNGNNQPGTQKETDWMEEIFGPSASQTNQPQF